MDFIQEMGIKDLEHVVLKAHDYMTLGSRKYKPGEPVLYFRNIQIALLSENTRIIAARGGFLNQPRVVWEDRDEVTFQFSNGTINPISMNMLFEANMLKEEKPSVPFQEIIEDDKIEYINGDTIKVELTHFPQQNKKRFYYGFAAENIQGQSLELIEEIALRDRTSGMEQYYATFKMPSEGFEYTSIMADYYYQPKTKAIRYNLDRERKPHLYTLEATFYLKDENDGLLHTGILEMPKVYIMSNINLRMGERADPTVGTFRIVAMPENVDSYEAMVCRVTYLDEDIYGI